ncbi:MAG TPA: response regulator [Thermoanaerobaculia bacterium]|jgi:DNA-binding response OmpR family regulator
MQPRLLIVDDEVAILNAMKGFFAQQGFEVDAVSDREEAQDLLLLRSYTAVIADLRLSGSFSTDGLEIVSFVRERYPGTRVILLTAYGSPEIEAEAWRRGVDAFLHKPLPLAEIAGQVKALLKGS